MKKSILSITLALVVSSLFAQSEKYMKAMQEKVAAVDTTHSPAALQDLSASFERIGDAEKTQWLPYYYAAFSEVYSGYMAAAGKMGGMSAQLDPIADRADQMIQKAEALSKDNSEIYVIKKMIATLRMTADPMSRYMEYGPQAQQALDMAKKLNPQNPRVYVLEGEDKFFTPEQFGGSKTEAKVLFQEALKKYDDFKPASAIDPSWGRTTAQYFISQIQ